jgi:hypothetical protein
LSGARSKFFQASVDALVKIDSFQGNEIEFFLQKEDLAIRVHFAEKRSSETCNLPDR